MRRVNLRTKKNIKRFVAFSLTAVMVISSEMPVLAGTINMPAAYGVKNEAIVDSLDAKLVEYLETMDNATVINGNDTDNSYDALVRAVASTMESQFVKAEVSTGSSSGEDGVDNAGESTVDGDNMTGGQITGGDNSGMPQINFNKDSFTFHTVNNNKDFYDEGEPYTFVDGKGEEHPYTGVYKGDIKVDSNLELPMEDVGSVDNPYIVLEMTFNTAYSDIRMQISDAGYFEYTQAGLDKIELTDEEKQQVKINAIQYLFECYADDIKKTNDKTIKEITAERNRQISVLQSQIKSINSDISALVAQREEYIRQTEDANLVNSIFNLIKQYDTTIVAVTLDDKKTEIEKFMKQREEFTANSQTLEADLKTAKTNFMYKVQEISESLIDNEYNDRIKVNTIESREEEVAEYKKAVLLAFEKACSGEVNWDWQIPNTINIYFNWQVGDQNVAGDIVSKVKSATVDEKGEIDNIQKQLNNNQLKLTQIDNVMNNINKLNIILFDFNKKIEEQREKITEIQNEIVLLQEPYTIAIPDVAEALNNRGSASIDSVISQLKSYLSNTTDMTDADIDAYIDRKLADAKEYKKTYERSIIISRYYEDELKFNLDFTREYVVENGKFVQYSGGETRKYSRPDEGTDYTGNAQYGEYKMKSFDCYNPLAQTKGAIYYGSSVSAQGGVFVPDYAFRKACLNMAYKTTLKADGTIDSQDICYDEYIFAGWLVEVNGVLEPIDKISDEDLKNYTELYTSWMVRKYEQAEFTLLMPDKKSYVGVKFDDNSAANSQYEVYLPNVIASCSNRNSVYHDPRNQLTMCVPVSTHVILRGSPYNDYLVTDTWTAFEANYADEISAWDFNFSKAEYDTVEKIKNVVPSLMADTDYYTMTYNTVVSIDSTGETVVEYYPYNVQVITMTPEELNKMVYYEYAQHTGDSAYYEADGSLKYHESERLNHFINNVDLFFFAGNSTAFKPFSVNEDGELGYYVSYKDYHTVEPQHNDVNRIEMFNPQCCPEICTVVDGKSVLDETKVKNQLSSAATTMPDLEWQVVDKLYRRTGDKSQSRRIAVIINEAFSDGIESCLGVTSGGTYYNHLPSEDGFGSKINCKKLLMLYFAFEDPTDMYEYYYLEDDTNNLLFNELGVKFDKIKGVPREKEESPFASTWFTGELYGYDNWCMMLFYPFEVIGLDHQAVLDGKYSNWYNAFAQSADFIESAGIGKQVNFKGLANQYAYSYNGDTSTNQGLFKHTISEIRNITNADNPNTYQAFEYFRRVRPIEIQDGAGHPFDDGVNGKIAPKSAIEFMVQNAQNGVLNYEDKKITILNEHIVREPMRTVTGASFSVSRVEAEEIGAQSASIEYTFSGTIGNKSILVVEYYWTKTFQNLDVACNKVGPTFYNYYTKSPEDPNTKWYKMPDSTTVIDPTIFKTYITTSDVPKTYDVAVDSPAPVITQNNGTNREQINRGTSYYFNALLKPQIKPDLMSTSVSPYYIIVVKEYSSMNAYLNNSAPVSVTTKNVIPIRLSLLFELD